MDPLSLAFQAVGLGMQIFGGISSAENARAQAKVSQDVARQEQSINDSKQAAMELQGRRAQLENVRNNQRARAQAVQNATTQGAQFGSGLAGGLGQIQDQTLFNMQGVNDALQTGRQINQYNSLISNDKQQLASLGADAATDQGIASLGGALLKSGPTIGNLSKGFGGGGFSLFGGGSPSGYGT